MNLIRDTWDSLSYKEFIDYLFSIRDMKYGKFHSSLGIDREVIGIRTPILKNIAKDIVKGNYREFLSLLDSFYYEEITLYGLIVSNIKDLECSISYLDKFKKRIDNWASCDIFCSSYKIVKKNRDYFWNYINSNINDCNFWIRRMCFVLLLDYYVDEKYLKRIFYLCDKYNTSDYYVKMAVSWLISICYIKYPCVTVRYIMDNKLDDFTHNKAIQKIRESHRVSKEDKDYLNKLKRV